MKLKSNLLGSSVGNIIKISVVSGSLLALGQGSITEVALDPCLAAELISTELEEHCSGGMVGDAQSFKPRKTLGFAGFSDIFESKVDALGALNYSEPSTRGLSLSSINTGSKNLYAVSKAASSTPLFASARSKTKAYYVGGKSTQKAWYSNLGGLNGKKSRGSVITSIAPYGSVGNIEKVPEPATILASLTAAGGGLILNAKRKRKSSKASKSA